MQWLRDRPALTTTVAMLVAAGTVAAIAAAWGWHSFADAWTHLHPGWLALAVGAALLTFPSYVLAYRCTAAVGDGPQLDPALVACVVIAGFGAFAPGGGFVLDKQALEALEADRRQAAIRVLGLGALEWALLAPAAWVSAVVVLVAGDGHVMGSLLWPWAIAVPLGVTAGLWVTTGARPGRLSRGRPRLRMALRGVRVLHELAAKLPGDAGAWIGAAGYWACDIASLYGALRFLGVHLNLAETILAFATGYALTRRSLPLGGAGVTEALMTFALHWVGLTIPVALAAVVVYRAFNFVLPTIPALLVLPEVKPLLDAADDDRTLRRPRRTRRPRGARRARRRRSPGPPARSA